MYYNEYSNKQQIKKLTNQVDNPTFQKRSKISVMKKNTVGIMLVYFIISICKIKLDRKKHIC